LKDQYKERGKVMKKVENKVTKIIREEFDARVSMMVVQYILDKGTENLSKITEEEILKLEGNGLMTANFVQALVRTGVRISKECNMIDDFLPYIVTELYVPKAKTNDVTVEFLDMFKKENGSYICRELLGCDLATDEGKQYAIANQLFVEFCPKMVESATIIAEKLLHD
jgi:hypothetical protein